MKFENFARRGRINRKGSMKISINEMIYLHEDSEIVKPFR